MLNFSYAYLPLVCLLWLAVCSDCWPLFSWVFFLPLSFKKREIYTYIWYKSFILYVLFKYFLPVCGFFFHSLNSVLTNRSYWFWQNLTYQFILLWVMLLVERGNKNFCKRFKSMSRSFFIFLHVDIQLFLYHLLKFLQSIFSSL